MLTLVKKFKYLIWWRIVVVMGYYSSLLPSEPVISLVLNLQKGRGVWVDQSKLKYDSPADLGWFSPVLWTLTPVPICLRSWAFSCPDLSAMAWPRPEGRRFISIIATKPFISSTQTCNCVQLDRDLLHRVIGMKSEFDSCRFLLTIQFITYSSFQIPSASGKNGRQMLVNRVQSIWIITTNNLKFWFR